MGVIGRRSSSLLLGDATLACDREGQAGGFARSDALAGDRSWEGDEAVDIRSGGLLHEAGTRCSLLAISMEMKGTFESPFKSVPALWRCVGHL